MTAEVMVWVVDTGTAYTNAVTYNTLAAADSAANPRGGSRCTMRRPRVRMIRQPPAQVPAARAQATRMMTHSGTL